MHMCKDTYTDRDTQATTHTTKTHRKTPRTYTYRQRHMCTGKDTCARQNHTNTYTQAKRHTRNDTHTTHIDKDTHACKAIH